MNLECSSLDNAENWSSLLHANAFTILRKWKYANALEGQR